jgi:hypothetical protein
MSQQNVLREKITLSFDGPALQNHEMEVSVLAHSLIAFKDLAEHVNASVNGKNVDVAVKVNGGFKEGSFIVSLFIDCMAAVLPNAPQILSSVVNVINITKFLQGKPPKAVEKADQDMVIENHTGEQATFNNCTFNTYNLVNNSNIKRDVANLVRPFNAGVERIDLAPSAPDLPPVTLDVKEKDVFIPPDDDAMEMEQKLYDVELLTPNFDGKTAGWRFYDIEDDVEFSASVVDEVFLGNVKDKKYNFQSGDVLKIEMTKIKRRVTQRTRTERIVNRVLEHSRPQ